MGCIHNLRSGGHRDGHRLRAALERDDAALRYRSDHSSGRTTSRCSIPDDVIRPAGVDSATEEWHIGVTVRVTGRG